MDTASEPAAGSLADVHDLATLDELLDGRMMMAGWSKLEPSLWSSPRANFKPTSWSWAEARAGLDSAGRMISTDKADRRNLFLINPVEGNSYATVRTLVSAYQMILPGEIARSHRHTPNALRLVLEVAEGVFTVVDGVRIDMEPGDVLLTPGWSWHGHGNDGSKPGYWIDFLDVPLVQLLEPMFFEHWAEGFQPTQTTTRQSPYVFPMSVTRERLAAQKPDVDGRVRIELGSPAMSTTALHMERLSSGFMTPVVKTTANQIVAVVEGEGKTLFQQQEFSWRTGDVIAIPSWQAHSHHAHEDTILFSVSDEPVLKKLDFLHQSRE